MHGNGNWKDWSILPLQQQCVALIGHRDLDKPLMPVSTPARGSMLQLCGPACLSGDVGWFSHSRTLPNAGGGDD